MYGKKEIISSFLSDNKNKVKYNYVCFFTLLVPIAFDFVKFGIHLKVFSTYISAPLSLILLFFLIRLSDK